MPCTASSSPIRRGGVFSALKNISYVLNTTQSLHRLLKIPGSTSDGLIEAEEVLEVLLRPLVKGGTDFGSDEEDLLPVLQYLDPDVEREQDSQIRLLILETLLLMTPTKASRDLMRGCGVYPVIKHLHLDETDEACIEAVERIVDMLMREEEEVVVAAGQIKA